MLLPWRTETRRVFAPASADMAASNATQHAITSTLARTPLTNRTIRRRGRPGATRKRTRGAPGAPLETELDLIDGGTEAIAAATGAGPKGAALMLRSHRPGGPFPTSASDGARGDIP